MRSVFFCSVLVAGILALILLFEAAVRAHDPSDYEAGELRAVAYKNGVVVGEAVVKTAGDPAKLVLTPDRREITADGFDLSYVLVEAVDSEGNACPLADDSVTFEVEGPAEIAAIGNGNPLSMESFQSIQHTLFYGKAVLILRSLGDKPGTVTVMATADGYESAKTQIRTRRIRVN